jgi:hypothetical protein
LALLINLIYAKDFNSKQSWPLNKIHFDFGFLVGRPFLMKFKNREIVEGLPKGGPKNFSSLKSIFCRRSAHQFW